jgi:hypothetical protein
MAFIQSIRFWPAMSVVGVVCIAASFGFCLAQEPMTAERQVDALIADLGSDSFEIRDAASRRLRERAEAVPALERARKSRDPEVARRAEDILEYFHRMEKEQQFARLVDLAKCGAIDQLVERLVRQKQADDAGTQWQVISDFAAKLTDLEEKTYGRVSLRQLDPVDAENFRRMPWGRAFLNVTPRGASPKLWNGRIVMRAEEIPWVSGIHTFRVAVSGNAKLAEVVGSVVFAGGSVEVRGGLGYSIILCDGDFRGDARLKNSLVIARGTIWCGEVVENSCLISCGKIAFRHPENVYETKVAENQATPLGFVKFFDAADVGIKAEGSDARVRVKEATKGKRFAAAGIQADDLVTAINGEKVNDYEGFRRLLRAKLAVEEDMVLKVRRSDQTLELRVSGKD